MVWLCSGTNIGWVGTVLYPHSRYAREIRSRDPLKRCLLQYDRLYVGSQAFLFNEVEGRVEAVRMRAVRTAKGGFPNNMTACFQASKKNPQSVFWVCR